jgi:hypothetical protein
MRDAVLAVAFVALGASAASASEMTGRLLAPQKQTLAARNVAAVSPSLQATRSTRLPVIREAADIPIIPLPKSLRPTRPPAGSPL